MAGSENKTEGDASHSSLDGGAYELLHRRLVAQSQSLRAGASELNEQRQALFGDTRFELLGSVRARTEHNCVPRDIANAGQHLLFGFNVYIGLKSQTSIADVFSVHQLQEVDGTVALETIPLQESFLADTQFERDFGELYTYYRDAKLTHLRRVGERLLMVFGTGRSATDTRVFRWAVNKDGSVTYIDARGERDNVFPPSHDFEWRAAERDQHVQGASPHISIEDELFIDTIGGNLTIKVENNTETGLGIYEEPVEDDKQTLADAQFEYARIGALIALRVRPYGESNWRHFVFNTRLKTVERIDSIASACLGLPEDHGVIFPGGYYLLDGEHKQFDADIEDLATQRRLRSPNGEDVLYVFHHLNEGRMLLLSYNLIRQELDNPLACHGYSMFDDGRLVIFRHDGDEPTRIHTMQLWRTPYVSDEFAASQPADAGLLAGIGNADLVRAIAEGYRINKLVQEAEPSTAVYEDIIKAVQNMLDSYHWLDAGEVGDLRHKLLPMRETGELVLGEFEKVRQLRADARAAMEQARQDQRGLLQESAHSEQKTIDEFVGTLTHLRQQRGHLITLRDLRYVDLDELDQMEQEVIEAFDALGERATQALLEDSAFEPYRDSVRDIEQQIDTASRSVELDSLNDQVSQISQALDVLNEVLGTVKVVDATQRTSIVESISEIFAQINRLKAALKLRQNSLGVDEAKAEFAAQFMLLGQSLNNALAQCERPEQCDEQLNRMIVQLEELDARFSQFDELSVELAEKRESIYEAFESVKQSLIEAQQKKVMSMQSAADRILQGVMRRGQQLDDADALNTFFATDPMVLKLREFVQSMREAGDSVRADDLESRIMASREQAGRSLRDRLDIFEEGGKTIRFGEHRFSVTEANLELSILPVDGRLNLHLSGTDFFAPLEDDEFDELADVWEASLLSESEGVYRGEFLAASLIAQSRQQLEPIVHQPQALAQFVKDAAATRYDEGYDRGVHDSDAAAIVASLLELEAVAGPLRFPARCRALAQWFWVLHHGRDECAQWHAAALSLGQLEQRFGASERERALVDAYLPSMIEVAQQVGVELLEFEVELAGQYLLDALKRPGPEFYIAKSSRDLLDDFLREIENHGHRSELESSVQALRESPRVQCFLARSWLERFVNKQVIAKPGASESDATQEYIHEAVSIWLLESQLRFHVHAASSRAEVDGLLGLHPRIRERKIKLVLDEFLPRLAQHNERYVPRFLRLREKKAEAAARAREQLRLEEFAPKPLATFVRNRLIDEVYLPLIGANLAKQMGALGADKRTDQMGLLLLISPPGYGKTTLMEYIANRLGLVFVKVNGPSLGHEVTSIDPAAAPDATSKQEVEKLNLALEMGNNVMLYVDDIQHTNPEFLQKFISMGDAQRKMEGVFRGRTRTYDLRGKRFCVVMAGNPYTESGDAFRIPDMLANRADIYNLGDLLGGQEAVFGLSYIENALTSNRVLAPLANRPLSDLYKFIAAADGGELDENELSQAYSAIEQREIIEILKRLRRVQQVVLEVNQAYIRSAAQQDRYRTEPPFKLQGSYRNMNKMAERVVSVMTVDELEQLIDDHYLGEAQTLTTGAEENLLKLAEIRGTLAAEQVQRWQEIKSRFARYQERDAEDDDPANRIARSLTELSSHVQALGAFADSAQANRSETMREEMQHLASFLTRMESALSQAELNVQVVNQPVPGMTKLLNQLADSYTNTLLPMLSATQHKLSLDESIWRTAKATHELLQRMLEEQNGQPMSTEKRVSPLSRAQSGENDGIAADVDSKDREY